jgi:transcriptional regulator GlxA family with amidase domain
MMHPFQINLLCFNEVEALDLAGPYEVFSTAARMARRMAEEKSQPYCDPRHPAQWRLSCVALGGAPIRARAGLTVMPTTSFEASAPADLLVVPGGVIDAPTRCPETLDWVRRQAAHASITASVCTGVFVLAAAAVLGPGQQVTTHWEDVGELRRLHPDLHVLEGPRWVDGGPIVSSAGISAGIDMSLHLVARLAGMALAERVARQMDYRWLKNPS